MKFSPPLQGLHLSFSLDGRYRWIFFILVVLIQFAVVVYMGWRWHNIAVDGIPYQWRCVPRLEVASFGTDYVRVVFPEDTTRWRDDTPPETGQQIYVYISRDASGLKIAACIPVCFWPPLRVCPWRALGHRHVHLPVPCR